MRWLATITLFSGCLGFLRDSDDTGDSDPVDDVENDPYEWEPCNTVHIDYIGPDEPVVGDSWTVWLYCDDALLMGPQLLRFDPTNFAMIGDDNSCTFNRVGTGTLRMQVGAEWAEMDVTVGPRN